MITVETTVERREWRTYSRDCPRGSGYCADQGQYQALVRRWKWRGITIWKRELDREEVLPHVWISRATLGFHGDASTVKMHPECFEAMQDAASEEGGWLEWTPGQERPTKESQ